MEQILCVLQVLTVMIKSYQLPKVGDALAVQARPSLAAAGSLSLWMIRKPHTDNQNMVRFLCTTELFSFLMCFLSWLNKQTNSPNYSPGPMVKILQ